MSLQKLVRISVLVTKKDGITDEEFHKHWAIVHAPLVQSLLVRHGIVKYTQVGSSWHELFRTRIEIQAKVG